MLLTYAWQPVTVADLDQGPRRENYLVAIAEAGSFGADLLLPLHERFERELLAGAPDARADWDRDPQVRRLLRVERAGRSIDRGQRWRGDGDPMRAFEMLNLLARHNLPFVTIVPAAVTAQTLAGIDLVVLLDEPTGGRRARPPPRSPNRAARSSRPRARRPIPNTFALEMRQRLGSERRVVDVWNGITVLVAPYSRPASEDLVLTVVNYAAQPLPIQIRVRGRFSEVQYRSPRPACRPPVLRSEERRDRIRPAGLE